MTNEEIIEALKAEVRRTAVGQFAYETVVRAVLSRLAEIGMSEEMLKAFYDAELTMSADATFSAALRALGKEG